MNKFHSWDLSPSSKERCGQCGMKTKSAGCCHDDVKVVKLQQDQVTGSALSFSFSKIDQPLLASSEYYDIPVVSFKGYNVILSHSPPLISGPDIYVRNRVFRI
jgi:hypothetical protein